MLMLSFKNKKSTLTVANKKALVLATLILLYLAPMMVVLLSNSYELTLGGRDEGYQMQSVLRYLQDQDFSYNLHLFPGNVEDFSVQHLDKATAWPPGYAFTIIVLSKIGLTWQRSSILFRFFIIILGIVAWMYFSKKIELSFRGLIIFLDVLFLYLLIMRNICDLVVWALFPLILINLFTIHTKRHIRLGNSFLLSLFVTIIILFKYSAWYIFPVILILLVLKFKKKALILIENIVLFSMFPIITILKLFQFNLGAKLSIASNISLSEMITIASDRFEGVWILEALNSIFLSPFRIDDIINKIFIKLNILNPVVYIYSLSLIVFFTFIYLIILGIKQRIIQKKLVIVLFVSFSFALSYLFLTTGKNPDSTWTPFENSRYLLAILPLITLIIIKFISMNKLIKTKIVTILIILFCIVTFSFSALRAYTDNENYISNNKAQELLLQRISEINLKENASSMILFSSYGTCTGLFNTNVEYLIKLTNKALYVTDINPKAYFSKETLMFIVVDSKKSNTSNYSKHRSEGYGSFIDIEEKNINGLIEKFNFNIIKEEDFVIFWNVFKKGTTIEEIQKVDKI